MVKPPPVLPTATSLSGEIDCLPSAHMSASGPRLGNGVDGKGCGLQVSRREEDRRERVKEREMGLGGRVRARARQQNSDREASKEGRNHARKRRGGERFGVSG
eukprot:2110886-Rhodomonas_salina.1